MGDIHINRHQIKIAAKDRECQHDHEQCEHKHSYNNDCDDDCDCENGCCDYNGKGE